MRNMTCPICGKRMLLNLKTNEVSCASCGFVRQDEISQLDEKQAEIKGRAPRPAAQIVFRGDILAAARAAFESGHDALYQRDRGAALGHFHRAAEFQPEFVDAHYWIASLSDDPRTKRERLNTVLAFMPQHLDALRDLMVLDGKLTAEAAARLEAGHEPSVRRATGPLPAEVEAVLCPICGGHLSVTATGVECAFCGYEAARAERGSGAPDSLTQGLLRRRAALTRWEIGARVFHCGQCGAEHTLHGRIAQRCRFCNSTNVMLTDAHHTFERPDGLIPFMLNETGAEEAIQQALNTVSERLNSLWNPNRVRSMRLEGVFVPFWVFDCTIDIHHMLTTHLAIDGGSTASTFQDMLDDIAICGVKSPPRRVVHRVSRYAWGDSVPYDPVWLTDHPAQLYDLDVDRASLDARELVAEVMRRKHNREVKRDPDGDSRNRTVHIERTSAGPIRAMAYQLLLAPLWVALLTEVDDDLRLALVNGQTGQVAFGDTTAPR
jgi:uncharacterized Zn finger protein (UPF0148 family)